MKRNDPLYRKRALTIFTLLLFVITGCGGATEPAPSATPTSAPPPFGVTYCDIKPSNMCLEGFGLNNDERLMILFKAAKPRFRDIYIRADGPDGESLFECRHAGSSPENVYCTGEPVDEEEIVKLNVFSKKSNNLIAIGVFNIQFTSLPEADVEFEAATDNATPAPPSAPPSYPNPSGPTPSYPNPTPSS